MKDRIETEVVGRGELDRNVKLGRGGIREIEFIVQTLQLLHAGRHPFLQSAQTLPCWRSWCNTSCWPAGRRRAAGRGLLFPARRRASAADGGQPADAHHPGGARRAERLARLMGFATVDAFRRLRAKHTRATSGAIYDRLAQGRRDAKPTLGLFPREFDGAEAEWKTAAGASIAFATLDKAFRLLQEFVRGPGLRPCLAAHASSWRGN